MVDTQPIRLTEEARFLVGGVTVTPSARTLAVAERSIVIEPRVMQVLVTLHQRCGEVVGRESLIDACWAGRTVGEDAVNRTILKLRRALSEIGGGATIETVAKVGYRLCAGDAEQVSDWAPPRRSWRRWFVGAGSAAALAVGGFLAIGRPARSSPIRVVVVQPLRVASSDAPARRLSQDFAGDLSRAALGNGRLVFAEPEETTERAAFTLHGSAASVGKNLHAVVSVTGRDGPAILWSHDYTAPLGDADGLRQQVGTNVAAVLVCALGAGGVPDRIDAQTTALYLETCNLHAGDHRREADLLHQVTTRAPMFAPGWTDLAISLAFASEKAEGTEAAAMRRESFVSAMRSLSLDPHQGMPYFARALLIPGLRHWRARERLVNDGLSMQPSLAQMYNLRARDLAAIGRLQDSIATNRRAVALDPLFPGKVFEMAQTLADAGRLDEAEAVIRHMRETWPDTGYTWMVRFETAAHIGDAREAEAMLDDMRGRFFNADEVAAWRAFLQAREMPTADRLRHAVAVLEEGRRLGAVTDAELVQDLALLRCPEMAIELALRMPLQTEDEFWFRSFLRPLRADKRFMTVARQQGLYSIWRSTGLWPDFCRDRSLLYDCRTAVPASVPEKREDGLGCQTPRTGWR